MGADVASFRAADPLTAQALENLVFDLKVRLAPPVVEPPVADPPLPGVTDPAATTPGTTASTTTVPATTTARPTTTTTATAPCGAEAGREPGPRR